MAGGRYRFRVIATAGDSAPRRLRDVARALSLRSATSPQRAECRSCRLASVAMRPLSLAAFAGIVVVIAFPNPTGALPADACERPAGVQRLVFSAAKYPNIRRHFRRAVRRRGWPRRLVLTRPGADERRERLLRDVPTRDGFDRDEYPPAVGRGRGLGLERGRRPRGWKADVRYVPSSENRSHGATLGALLAPFCDACASGTRSADRLESSPGKWCKRSSLISSGKWWAAQAGWSAGTSSLISLSV
jgi:hypothetical protein